MSAVGWSAVIGVKLTKSLRVNLGWIVRKGLYREVIGGWKLNVRLNLPKLAFIEQRRAMKLHRKGVGMFPADNADARR